MTTNRENAASGLGWNQTPLSRFGRSATRLPLPCAGAREGSFCPLRALGAWLPGPAAAPAAEVEADQAGGAVVADGDVAVGDVVPVDVGGVYDRARDGGAAVRLAARPFSSSDQTETAVAASHASIGSRRFSSQRLKR